jgi:rare lipoprotein A
LQLKPILSITCLTLFTIILTGCGGQQNTRTTQRAPSVQKPQSTQQQHPPTASQKANKGGYYLDDGPEDTPPSNLDQIPDAVPQAVTPNPNNSKPYVALGQTYEPMKSIQPFKQSGRASWYGKRFHGRKTASGERYDMYAMTAAHPTLPLPSYVRVTNLNNDRSVIVRVNDRGPFARDRIIDLSYAAANKIDLIKHGTAKVEIELVTPDSLNQESNNSDSVSPEKASVEKTTLANSSGTLDADINTANSQSSPFFVQAGAFQHESNANNLKQNILKLGITTQENINKVYNGSLYRLVLGPFHSESEAHQVASKILEKLSISSIIKSSVNDTF